MSDNSTIFGNKIMKEGVYKSKYLIESIDDNWWF